MYHIFFIHMSTDVHDDSRHQFVAFACISLITNDIEHMFTYLLSVFNVFFRKMFIQAPLPF